MMGRPVYSRDSSSPDNDSSFSKKEKNRLAAARFRNKQKSQIQDYKSLCEQQEKEILQLKTELKISAERVTELQRMLDIAMAYRSIPVALSFSQTTPQQSTASQSTVTSASELAQALAQAQIQAQVQAQTQVLSTPLNQDISNSQIRSFNDSLDWQNTPGSTTFEESICSVLSNAST
ncbi:hypothetical protein WR25_03216, partial [Diploscapter pachys]